MSERRIKSPRNPGPVVINYYWGVACLGTVWPWPAWAWHCVLRFIWYICHLKISCFVYLHRFSTWTLLCTHCTKFLFRILKRLESLCVLYYLQNFFYHPKLHLCVNSVKSNSSSTFFREKIRIPMCIYDVYSFVNKSPIICYFTISFQCWKNITFILLLE